jgi:hypothetical protein
MQLHTSEPAGEKLRLKGIDTHTEANPYLEGEQMPEHNWRSSWTKPSGWIAHYHQDDCVVRLLLKGSFIPPRSQRELRDLTQYGTQWVEEKTRTVKRLHKVLEDANIKLASVETDILGVSSRARLEALIEGRKDLINLADLAQRQLRDKIQELEKAWKGA